MGVFGELSHFS